MNVTEYWPENSLPYRGNDAWVCDLDDGKMCRHESPEPGFYPLSNDEKALFDRHGVKVVEVPWTYVVGLMRYTSCLSIPS